MPKITRPKRIWRWSAPGAAIAIRKSGLTAEGLASQVRELLLSRSRRRDMADAGHKLGRPEAWPQSSTICHVLGMPADGAADGGGNGEKPVPPKAESTPASGASKLQSAADLRSGNMRRARVRRAPLRIRPVVIPAGYKRRPGQLLLRGAAHFGYWTATRRVRTSDVDERVLATFCRHVARCTCVHPFRGRDRYHRAGAQHLLAHLQRVDIAARSATRSKNVPPVIEHFSAWFRRHRGVQESTLVTYVPLVREFVAALGDNPAAYDAAQVRAFILAQASHSGRSRIKSLVNAVRMFLRFLAVVGACSADLVAAVPRIAQWKLAALPRYLEAADVERLVAGCTPKTSAGARDRAVVLLLARLGLRAGDVRNLRLSDIDWAATPRPRHGQGSLRDMAAFASGRGRRHLALPDAASPRD